MFYYSIKLLKSVLDFYFYCGMVDRSQYLMIISKQKTSCEELIILVSDIARAVEILDEDEKSVVCLRHSGFIFDEIRQKLLIDKQKAINLYDSAIIKMMFYLNGKTEND